MNQPQNSTNFVASPSHSYAYEASISTGKEWEPETGTYYFGARRYDPTIGMWLGMDPVREFFSPYNYAGNTPLLSIDPDGRKVLEDDQKGEIQPGADDWFRSDGPSDEQKERLSLFQIGPYWASMLEVGVDIPDAIIEKVSGASVSENQKEENEVYVWFKLMEDVDVNGIGNLFISAIPSETTLRGSVSPEQGRGVFDLNKPLLGGLVSNVIIKFDPIGIGQFIAPNPLLPSNLKHQGLQVNNISVHWGIFQPFSASYLLLPPRAMPRMMGGKGGALGN